MRAENTLTAVAAVAALAIATAAVTTEPTRRSAGPSTAETATVALAARPTHVSSTPSATVRSPSHPAKPRDVRYVVGYGETLWGISARHYDDVVAGMRTIKRRNGLRRNKVLAGEVLVLPAVTRP